MIDNSLFDFKLNKGVTTGSTQKPVNREPGKWIKPDEEVSIGGLSIKRGFIYVGGDLKSLDHFFIESSLINPDLRVNFSSPDKEGVLLGYWPNYSTIPPECRATFLSWLAGDRSDQNISIGYIFLYFYGLERRLITINKNDEITEHEFKKIVKELYRLKEVYGHNHSFKTYVTSLLSYIISIHHNYFNGVMDPSLFTKGKKISPGLKYLLAAKADKDLAIDEKLAIAWLKGNPNYTLKIPAIRCHNEFDELFKVKFIMKFKEGLKITANKTRLKLLYIPSSASLKTYKGRIFDLPDISKLKAPFKKLMDISEECIKELEPYSRYLGKSNKKESLEAISLIPREIISTIDNIQFTNFKHYIKNNSEHEYSIFKVPVLLDFFSEDPIEKLTNKELLKLSRILILAGYSMVPEIPVHNEKPTLEDIIVVYPENMGKFKPSGIFNLKVLIIKLVLIYKNNKIDKNQKEVLINMVKKDDKLTIKEKKSLLAYITWKIHTPLTNIRLKGFIEKLSEKERIMTGQIIIDIVSINGKVTPNETILLKKFYEKLELNGSLVTKEISSRNLFSLNKELIQKHEKDTKDVHALLETIFVDDIVEREEKEANITGLDKAHSELYTKLITKEEWSGEEVKIICLELGLMQNGAIEVINDWAYDKTDAPLIEDGDTLKIDFEILEELQ